MTDRYARIAGVYDALCAVGSFGAVGCCRRDALRAIRPGDRVLFAGAGTGAEAVLAARAGARVTVLDRSPAMLRRAERRARDAGVTLVAIRSDILDHEAASYDTVVANFFLNVFAPDDMRRVLARLTASTAPDGRVVIGDVVLPRGRAARAATRLYWAGASMLFRMLTRNAVHPVYDYDIELNRLGFRTVDVRRRGCFASSVAASEHRPEATEARRS